MKCDGCSYWVDAVAFHRGAFRRYNACHGRTGCVKDEARARRVILFGSGALERYEQLRSQYDVIVLRHERPCHSNGWLRTIEVQLKSDSSGAKVMETDA